MGKKLENVKELLKKYNQEHLLHFYEALNDREKEELINDIMNIDFQLIKDIYSKKEIIHGENYYELKPLRAINLKKASKEDKEKYYNLGLDALRAGKVAVYLVAGGQGSRLGHNGPKGTYDIGLPSGKSLFQLQCERLLYLSKTAGTYIPFYVMTSNENHNITVNFFEKNEYFGYDKKMIKFFKQDTLPAVDEEGKVFLSEKSRVNKSPNGNGGCFVALKDSGALKDMKEKGMEWVFLYGVDNALVRVADPYFIGFAIYSGKQAATKVVAKKHAGEKVGVLCYKNNKPAIVEYSEIPEALTKELDNEGKLLYSNANILNHLLQLEFIENVINEKLPLHIAHKKIEHIDMEGNKKLPKEPNGYKFEYFLFDVFEKLEDMAALEVEREEEFAPVKNREGEDSPKTARELIMSLHKKWLINAGVDERLLKGKEVEISPLVSSGGENLKDEIIKEVLDSNNIK